MNLASRIVARWAGTKALVDTGEKTFMGGTIYRMPVKQDTFLHFTLEERVPEILATGKLLQDPPYSKFGPDSVYAISLTYGIYQASVQVTHIKGKNLKAIRFKTNAKPKQGFVEEVLWDMDVPLIRPEILEPAQASALLQRSPIKLGDQDMVLYI